MNLNKLLNEDYINQGIAFFLAINTFIFYTIIFNVVVEQDSAAFIKFIKIIFLLIISAIFIKYYRQLFHSKLILLLLIYGIIYSIFKSNVIFIIVIPVMIGVILSGLDLRLFLNNYINYSLILTVIFFIIYIIYFEKFEANSYLSLRPDVEGNVTNLITRKTFIFKSPNNLGLFINIMALISVLLNRNKLFIALCTLSFLSFFFTNSRGALIVTISFIFINIFKDFIYKNKRQSIITMLILTFLPLILVECLNEKWLTIFDNHSSNRLHYIDILFKFTIFPNLNGYTLDSSIISFLNTQGLIITLAFLYILYKTSIMSNQSIILSIGLLIIGLFENIINQYILLMPLVYSMFLCECEKNKISHKKQLPLNLD